MRVMDLNKIIAKISHAAILTLSFAIGFFASGLLIYFIYTQIFRAEVPDYFNKPNSLFWLLFDLITLVAGGFAAYCAKKYIIDSPAFSQFMENATKNSLGIIGIIIVALVSLVVLSILTYFLVLALAFFNCYISGCKLDFD